MFRDLEDVKPADLDRGFLDLPDSRFSLAANYRVNTIVNSSTVWFVFQLLISFCQQGCTIARDEIPAALKIKLTSDDIEATREEMVNEAESVLLELNGELQRYHIFIGQMHRISELFEKQKFRFNNVDKLKDHSVVKDVLKNLEKHFADELKDYEQDAT